MGLANSASVAIYVIRSAKLAFDSNLSGPILGSSSYIFKPHLPTSVIICSEKTGTFILGKE